MFKKITDSISLYALVDDYRDARWSLTYALVGYDWAAVVLSHGLIPVTKSTTP